MSTDGVRGLITIDASSVDEMKQLRDDFTRFMMQYKFGIDEVTTKISILREEFSHMHDYNPIEHVSSRLKTPESIIDKVQRKGFDPSFETIRESITDIAGVRITCSFVSDTYRVFDMLTSQHDIRLVAVKDYIKNPKPNGYKSLHAIVEVPVFLSDGVVPVLVEVQIRTIAMDFWASLEHKIYYKYDQQVPQELLDDLREAAETASRLDRKMERLHDEIRVVAQPENPPQSRPSDAGDAVVPTVQAIEQLQRFRAHFGEV
ncbi:GTP pyrophosphokinase [Compostimonas suwonensis]|uniref:Putative GTP pyrophosphokinase n=1 Tax=Compostimonas suwonensis TaxID=1048394 RepID=A0A2M9BCF1_9MICO|nr:GTP pyrophosphokinase family protein [Compostimonas suwonensis]PJJ55584.1 putative GTP pyrophosphokinase [Compostimonas suwonensis]